MASCHVCEETNGQCKRLDEKTDKLDRPQQAQTQHKGNAVRYCALVDPERALFDEAYCQDQNQSKNRKPSGYSQVASCSCETGDHAKIITEKYEEECRCGLH